MNVTIEDERRRAPRVDRRRRPRGGRRAPERRAKWQRITWLVVAYAAYLAFRSPTMIRRMWRRRSS